LAVQQYGLQLADACSETHYIAGKLADKATLFEAELFGMQLSAKTASGAMDSSHTGVLVYLIGQRHCALPSGIGEYAAESGSVDLLKCLRQKEVVFTTHMCTLAASAGHLSAVQYILSTRSCICELAINARCNICDWVKCRSLYHAASSGNVAMVQWLHQKQCAEYNGSVLSGAASAGQTAMCEYLRSQLCPLCESACCAAAYGGHLSTLTWLLEHGCQCHTLEVLVTAAQGGSIPVMEYLQQHGLMSTTAQLTKMLCWAGANNHLQAAKWLRDQGAEWPAQLSCGFFFQWTGDVLTWARDEGCTSPTLL
jgi:Ankyrin repeats (many copies)